jgi:hypothetical protein
MVKFAIQHRSPFLGMKKVLLLLLVASACFALPALAADPPGFGGGSPDPIPVDGGASLLAAGGIGYAIKRLRAKKGSAQKA